MRTVLTRFDQFLIAQRSSVVQFGNLGPNALRGANFAWSDSYLTFRDFSGIAKVVSLLAQKSERDCTPAHRWRQMLEFTPQLVRLFGPDHERIYANRTGLDYLGLSLEEWRQIRDMCRRVHLDDGDRMRAPFLTVLVLLALLSSWRCDCAKLMEVIVGFSFGTILWATTKGRSRDGMLPVPTSRIASRLKIGFSARTWLCVKKSTKPRCLKRLSEHQIALLRVLQEHEFERIGGSRRIRADVRVIAATNHDLQAAIAQGLSAATYFTA